MNTQKELEAIRKDLITKILQCVEGKLSIENLITFAMPLNNKPELNTDTSFLQSFTLLDFLSQQLINGNKDLVSPQIIKESCTYMLNKLTPSDAYVP